MSETAPRADYHDPERMPGAGDDRGGIWHPRYLWVTVGAVAMIFLAATQALAVTTVMPLVSADLGGDALYALAFSGTLATSVIGMVAVGAWCDRRDPVLPLATSVALFVAGLVIAGLAPSMEVLVLGRLLQGLGTGGQTVALYVVVARVYPAHLHGRVFAAFSAAWIIPSIVGPFLAGFVAEQLHWRWVFLGVAVLTLVAFTVVYLRLHDLPLRVEDPSRAPVARRLALATVVAAGALALSLAGEAGPWTGVVVAVALVAIALAIRPLLPAGTALLWAAGAEVQGRFGDRLGNARITLFGVTLLLAATLIAAATAAWHLPAWTIIAGWSLAGAGMGLMYPRLTVLTLAYSTPQNQGFNSSALSISDSIGASAAIAVMGLTFVALRATDASFPAVFAIAAALAVLAVVPGLRMTVSSRGARAAA